MKPADYRKLAKEDQIQAAIVEWIRLHRHLEVFHVPNEGKRSEAAAGWLRKMGMVAGVADLVVMWQANGIGFLEVKTKRGKQTNEQKMFQARCEALRHRYAVVRSVSEAGMVLGQWGAI